MTPQEANTLVNSRDVIRENLKFLREYARRLLVEADDSLASIEDFKNVLMDEYMTVGAALRLSERDLMVLLFKNILDR
jgi:hypothetical protein